MPLDPGTKLGPYEITGLLGAGGMGEVYAATDPALGREVAIKVVSAALAADPQQSARFAREARALAALNHPNIEAIYALGQDGDRPYLVLELVHGESLGERIARGPLPWREALGLAAQLAEALAAAHERGIVHRDLKPQNVRVARGDRVKLLDFGLARPVVVPAADGATASIGPTLPGTVLGTPAYMSPEQLRAQAVDARTDMWSFGAVLFEMLAGRHAFARHDASFAEIAAAVLGGEPDWRALPPSVPPALAALLRRCLAKDPAARPADAGVLVAELARIDRPDAAALGAAPVQLVQLTFEHGTKQFPAWSPDGSEIAYAAPAGAVRKLFRLRPGGDPVPLTRGPHDDLLPAWAPDGKTVYFVRGREPGARLEPGDVFGIYLEGDIISIDLATGEERRIAEHAFNPAPSPDGRRIAFDASWAGPRRVWLVDRNGRNPVQLSEDTTEAVAHVRPRWSPDGARLACQLVERTRFDLLVVDVASRAAHRPAAGEFQNYQPAWTPGGDALLFASYRSGGLNLWSLPLDASARAAGVARQLTSGAGQDVEPDVAPDGRVAFTILRQNASLYRLPVDPRTGRATGPPEEVVASSREDSRGAWSPDGTRIAFNSDRAGPMGIWLREPNGRVVALTAGPGDYQPNWSPDGARLAFFSTRSGHPGIWALDLRTGTALPLSPSARPGAVRGIEINPFFSPDGRTIAYQSDADGRLEAWLMDADGAHPHPLTRCGVSGHFLRWTPDGRFVVFRTPGPPPRTMRVPVDGGDPEPLPEVAGGAHMSFSPDVSRIMDVVNHKTLWVSPLDGGAPEPVFAFDDPEVRIDYPVWSPDGRWILFDRFRPQGGDIWMIEKT